MVCLVNTSAKDDSIEHETQAYHHQSYGHTIGDTYDLTVTFTVSNNPSISTGKTEKKFADTAQKIFSIKKNI